MDYNIFDSVWNSIVELRNAACKDVIWLWPNLPLEKIKSLLWLSAYCSILFWAFNKFCFNCCRTSSLITNSVSTASIEEDPGEYVLVVLGGLPYKTWNGVIPVEEWNDVLYHNFAQIKNFAQVWGFYE